MPEPKRDTPLSEIFFYSCYIKMRSCALVLAFIGLSTAMAADTNQTIVHAMEDAQGAALYIVNLIISGSHNIVAGVYNAIVSE